MYQYSEWTDLWRPCLHIKFLQKDLMPVTVLHVESKFKAFGIQNVKSSCSGFRA